MNKIELSISSSTGNLYLVEHFIENIVTAFKVGDKLKGSITLALIEAANNAIVYGNKKNPQKIVRFTAVKNYQKIRITVEDQGEGFDYRHVPLPLLSPAGEGLTGRGIYIMSKLSDELLFTGNGSKVTLTFYTTE